MLRSKKTLLLPTTPTEYPHGTFVKTEKGFFFIKNSASRLTLMTSRVLESWSPPRVVETTEAAVGRYRVTATMKFRNGSLIWNLADGKVYLIEDGKRRWVKSPDVFTRLGLSPNLKTEDIFIVSEKEIELHQIGDPLT